MCPHERAAFDLGVGGGRAQFDPAVFLNDPIQSWNRRHVHQRLDRGMIAEFKVQDQIGTAGHDLGVLVVVLEERQRFLDGVW